MYTEKNGRGCSVIAAICFVLYVIYFIWVYVKYQMWLGWELYSRTQGIDLDVIIVIRILDVCIAMAFAILLFIGKRSVGGLVVSGLSMLFELYFFLKNYSILNLCYLAAYALLFFIFLLSVVPFSRKTSIAVKVLWMFPSVTFLIGYLNYWLYWRPFRYSIFEWKYTFSSIIEIAALFYTGLWLKREMVAAGNTADQKKLHVAFKPQVAATQNYDVSIGADRLETYKSLLDAGIMTQEEFDDKKKQIVGL
ncbi:MAG: SHOCT domain-containing protein [Lachnospiraceae bacterium]|nr:SHOCT domain-containing protein [Lachnospiraceae bacterium]